MSNPMPNNIIQCEALTKTYTGLDVAVLNGISPTAHREAETAKAHRG